MWILVFGLSWAIGLAVSTASLAVCMWILVDDHESPYKTDGFAVTIGKCAAIAAINSVLGVVSCGILALIGYFLSIRFVFHTTWPKAFLIGICNVGVLMMVQIAVNFLLTGSISPW